MRIRLRKGKQKDLILFAKKNKTWKELSNLTKIKESYISRDLFCERRLLKKKDYDKLKDISNKDFDKFILEVLPENWGKSKGGKNSSKNIKLLKKPTEDEKLAEIIGIILGDGHVSNIKIGKKVRVYCIRIAGNSKTDKDYIFNYIPKIFQEVFFEKGSIINNPSNNFGYYTLYGKRLVEYLKTKGIKSGNKKKNNQGIPNWIKKDHQLLKKCIRGLIDTDGSIHKISKNNKNLRIEFTSAIPKLLKDTRDSFILLGYSPSKIISSKHFFISKKEEVKRYVKDIGFGNNKNLKRYYHLGKN